MEDNKNQINYRKIKEEAEELARLAAEQIAEEEKAEIAAKAEKKVTVAASQSANKSTGLGLGLEETSEQTSGISTGLATEDYAGDKTGVTTGLQDDQPVVQPSEASNQQKQPKKPDKQPKKKKTAGKGGNGSKPAKKRKPRNQKGILYFIIIGLIGIVAASAWIIGDAGKSKQAEISKADAEIIAQGTQAISEVKIPEVRTRENVSNNFHVISHRGYPSKAEEHSFEGYDLALDAGTMYIEQDIVTSADGTLYVSHDDTAARLTGNSGRFADMTDAEIDALTTYGGNKILKLSDVFDRYGKTVGYVIELRDNKDATIGAFEKLMDQYNMADNVIVQSFEANVLETLEEKYPDMTKMYLCKNPDGRSRGIGLACADIVCINKSYMNEFGADSVHNSGKKFGVYTIDAENHIMEAIRIGVDYYFTDDTAKALSLEKRYRND